MKWEKRERQILPRLDRGGDWSTERKVLLDVGDGRRVWWWPGSMEWAGLGCFSYRKGTLDVEYPNDTYAMSMNKTVLEGGRLSKARLNAPELREAIAKLLGLTVADLPELDPRMTWVRCGA